jgi:hypothetical protein
MRFYLKSKIRQKRAGDVVQVVESLLSKSKACYFKAQYYQKKKNIKKETHIFRMRPVFSS